MPLPATIKESTLYRGAYLLVSLAVLFLDQWTKGLITRTFEVHQSSAVIANFFDITYVRNSGAAFGLFASVDSSLKAVILNAVAVLVFFVVSAYALRTSHKSVRLQTGFALILGGAVGNLLDRVRFGFVVDFLEDPTHRAIVRSIIDLGHNLGLHVVAEGIETASVLEALREADCDIAQGYYLARPMPIGDLPRFLATTSTVTSQGSSQPA